MSTVLLSGAGGLGGLASIKTLQKTTDHNIITVDMNHKSAGFYFADHSEVVPEVASPEWPSEMKKVIKKYGVEVYIPLIDEELLRLPQLRSKIPDSVAIASPSHEFISIMNDKWTMTKKFDEYGFHIPNTVLGSDADSLSETDFPLLLKPREGRGSKGIEIIESHSDISECFINSTYQPEEVILQEFIDGTEFTTSVIGTKDNRLLAVVPKEVISRPEGNTAHGVTRDEERIIMECEDIFEAFHPEGQFNIQHMCTDESIYALEINPRFSSTACLTVESGANELDLIIRDCLGKSIPRDVEFKPDMHMLRYTDHIVGSKDELIKRPYDEYNN
jgi:carbamoyl-phosphate synthase large subunit